jgi:hypothetical protein
MAFRLRPLGTTVSGDESVIRGRLESGAYMGPESILITSQDGRQCRTHVHSHGMEFPRGWPILPEHLETVVILNVPRLPDGFTPASVEGLGVVESAPERVDVTHYLDAIEFWAMQLAFRFTSEQIEDPGLEFLGISAERVDDWYESSISALQSLGRWPYIRLSLPESRYIELEMAASIEFQDRFWIGHLSGSERVLLGYHSGHFSLPAFRLEEVHWLAAHFEASPAPLLWLSATYLDGGVLPVAFAENLVSRIPGASRAGIRPLAEALLQNITVSDLVWSRHPTLGWVNNWSYSQRNPESPLSILSQSNFSYIRGFFP